MGQQVSIFSPSSRDGNAGGENNAVNDFIRRRHWADNRFKIEELARIKRAEETRQLQLQRDTHDRSKENQQLLKKIFSKLDPTVTKIDTEIKGEVQVSFKWDFTKDQILVKVIKCRDLGLNSITGKTANPYIAVSLYPDPEGIGEKLTTVSHKPQNPVYNEIFAFSMDEVGLCDTKVIVKVFDHDFVGENEFMGEAVINLSDFNFTQEPVHTAWYSLQPETDLTISGELHLRLEFFPPHTLAVSIDKAHGLKIPSEASQINPFVKVGVPGLEEIYVTEVKSGQTEPLWEETFNFKIPVEEFSFRYVVMTILSEDGKEENTTLGHVVVDLDNLDPEVGFEGAFSLSDMSKSDRLKNKWFQNATVQEFKEALQAHSSFQYPKLLFQHNHEGNKVVRLTCRKAGAKAKLSLVNGIPVV